MIDFYAGPRTSLYKVWHIPQIPSEAFVRGCDSLLEASAILNAIADYDLFLLKHGHRVDFASASGIVIWDSTEGPYGEYVELDEDEYRDDLYPSE